MFCKKCGTEMSDDARFCPKCGYGYIGQEHGSYCYENDEEEKKAKEKTTNAE